MSDSLAVIADIHGNVWALEAVLADIERRGISDMFDLGDSLYGPLDPAATGDLLIERGVPSIRGNCDRMLLESPLTPAASATVERLSPRHLEWLAALPPTRVVLDRVLLCHGTPDDDNRYLLERPTSRGGRLRPYDEIALDVAGISQTVICCGHSHVPRVVYLPGASRSTLLVNPGSIGLPAYSEDTPSPHVMESHTPQAKYAVMTLTDGATNTWAVELVQVPYDWASAAACAVAADRSDWAFALATERAR